MSTLKAFIQSLDPKTLPRVLRIVSGVYYQGSVYELFGNECCLPTGEEIKVIGLKIHKITASFFDNSEGGQRLQTVDLPLDYPGLFQIEADTMPYLSVEEIASNVPIGSSRFGHPCFYSPTEVNLPNFTIQSGERIMFNSVEDVDGVLSMNCGVLRDSQHHSLALALSYQGEFYECADDQIYTLKEIVEWKIARSRRRTVLLHNLLHTYENSPNPFPDDFKGPLRLSLIYDVQAVMKYRKDIVHILSDLDVEVKDVTEQCDMKCFVQTFSLCDIFERTSKEFPLIAEVIEEPTGSQNTHNLFKHGTEIVFHKKSQELRTLASEIRSDSPKKHFLIPMSYKGKFKRRPRAFLTVYDLEIAKGTNEQLHVVATKSFDSTNKDLSSIFVGDQFLVLKRHSMEIEDSGQKTVVDVLECEKIVGNTYEKSYLPMHIEGGFVEVIHDKKQYSIADLCKTFQFPFNVKVSVRDLNTMGDDILAAIPCIQLEEEITDAYLLVSIGGKPEETWEIPVYRLSVSVQLVNKSVKKPALLPSRTHVEEISEEQYYMVRRYENHVQEPPPRPPKMPLKGPMGARGITVPVQSRPKPPRSPKTLNVQPATKPHLHPTAAGSSTMKNTCQSEAGTTEPEKERSQATTTAEPPRAIGYAQKDLCIKQKTEYVEEAVIDEIRKKLKDSAFHPKPYPKNKKGNM